VLLWGGGCPVTRTWRRLPSLPAPRDGATATWTGKEVLLVGGDNSLAVAAAPLRDAMAYDPQQDSWRTLSRLEIARSRAAPR
jgi:N-acetylneuraminic acid mutarotase